MQKYKYLLLTQLGFQLCNQYLLMCLIVYFSSSTSLLGPEPTDQLILPLQQGEFGSTHTAVPFLTHLYVYIHCMYWITENEDKAFSDHMFKSLSVLQEAVSCCVHCDAGLNKNKVNKNALHEH